MTPRFSTLPGEITIYADANARGAGGDGSLLKPFATVEAAVDHAAGLGTNVTVELRAGTYRTTGVVLTPQHSGLTIQNYNGEEAIVSGAVHVPSTVENWPV